jgi:hypothetical protein
MKKLLIFLMACSLFTACNNDKTARERDRTNSSRDKDDYRNDDKSSDRNDARNTDDNSRDRDKSDNSNDRNDDNSRNDDRTSSGGWTSAERHEFVSNCVNTAVSGGMESPRAQSYCDCMQVKLERMYPRSSDVVNIDVESTEMQNMMRNCLQ